jgi:uncharacterized Zn finger protein (UPF0148 family)
MPYRSKTTLDSMKSAKCPKCSSNRLMVSRGKLSCTNCGFVIGKTNEGRSNKYGAIRTEFNGKKYDSKFEASVAEELETQKLAGEIIDYDTHYRVDMNVHREDGSLAFVVKHKVDFRIHNLDGSYKLLEAKGVETADYKFRRKCLENIWLPLHKDYEYEVIKQRR